MGCYDETLAFLDRIGAADRVRWQSGLKVPMIDRARPSQRAVAAGAAVAAALARRRAGVGCAQLVASGSRCLRIGATDRSGSAAGRHSEQAPTEPFAHWLDRQRPGAAAVRVVLGAARAGRAQSIDRSGGGVAFHRACSSACSAPIRRRPRWCCRRCRSTSCMPSRRARGSKRAAAKCASTRRRRSSIEGERVSGVRVRDELIDAPVVISTVPWYAFHALFDAPPAATGRDHRQRHRAREPADRDRQPVVRSRGDARAAGRPAGTQLPMGVRSPRASSAATRRTCR